MSNLNSKELKVNIDFDKAHEAWMLNKTKNGTGTYSYICTGKTVKGLPCKKKPLKHCDYCCVHNCKNYIQHRRNTKAVLGLYLLS